MAEYILGTGDQERARLALQQEVWGDVTERFLDRLGIGAGARVADVGCGPGLLVDGWRRRIGPDGSLLLVDDSERWTALLDERGAREGWTNVRVYRGRVEDVALEDGGFDVVFARWVFSFLPDPAAVVTRCARALRPGGVLALQDYNHEGISLFPESAGFAAVVRATRAYYRKGGGDTWVAGRLPGMMQQAGLEIVDLRPNVLAGGPESPAFRWADAFFPVFSGVYQEQGLLTEAERAAFLADWSARRTDRAAMFFSPIVVDVAGRRP